MNNFWAYLTDEERQKEIEIRRERFTKNNPMKNPLVKEKSKQHANPWMKGRTYEEIYGEDALKYKNIAREIGWKNKGKKRTLEQKQYISQKTKEAMNTPEFKEIFSEKMKELGQRESWREKHRQIRMKQIFPHKDTSIEIALQKELDKLNIKYETHYPVTGQPDIAILDGGKSIYIFVDGCYWHCCERCFPNGNRHIYKREYDKQVTKEHVDNGAIVLRFWEHEINKNLKKCIEKIISTIDRKRQDYSRLRRALLRKRPRIYTKRR